MASPTKSGENASYAGFNATFPDRVHAPSLSLKRSRHPSVSSPITFPLPKPEVPVCPRDMPITAGMTVPEAAVNEYD